MSPQLISSRKRSVEPLARVSVVNFTPATRALVSCDFYKMHNISAKQVDLVMTSQTCQDTREDIDKKKLLLDLLVISCDLLDLRVFSVHYLCLVLRAWTHPPRSVACLHHLKGRSSRKKFPKDRVPRPLWIPLDR